MTWIGVNPKNYRRIALHAISIAAEQKILINGKQTDNFSEGGPLTQPGIRRLRDFEIGDGDRPILGFHHHPREMGIDSEFKMVAEHCAEQGWLSLV
ncbi:MAG: hypothetical protein MK142_16600 [Pseudomonadales bacterium]|nr:hypothetical protein [Pseudomonadales bacterium]